MRLYNQKPARQRWGVGKEILGRNERKIVENMTDKIKNFFAQAGEVAERLAHGAWRGVKFATNAVLSAFVAVASIYAMSFDMVMEMATWPWSKSIGPAMAAKRPPSGGGMSSPLLFSRSSSPNR